MGETATVRVPNSGLHVDLPETTRPGRVAAEGIPDVRAFLGKTR